MFQSEINGQKVVGFSESDIDKVMEILDNEMAVAQMKGNMEAFYSAKGKYQSFKSMKDSIE